MTLSGLRRRLFWWSRVFGLFPFNGDGRLSKCWLVYSCVLHSMVRTWSAAFLIIHWTSARRLMARKLTATIAFYAQNSLLILTPLLQFAFLIDNPGGFERALRAIYRLNPNQIRSDCVLKLFLAVSAVTYVSHFVIVPVVMNPYRNWTVALANLTLLYNELACMLIILQFIVILDEVSGRVFSLADGLLFEPERFCDLFQHCVDLAGNVNSVYTRQNLTMLGKIFVQLCSSTFLLLTTTDHNRAHRMIWVLHLPFILLQVITVSSIVGAVEKFKSSAEKFNSELFRLMRENKELCKNEKLQLYVTMKQTVNFTACGFFTLGYPLVTSIIAAATTYLVILVQFSMPPPPKS